MQAEFFIPFKVGFLKQNWLVSSSIDAWIDITFDILFLMDIFVSFYKAYYNSKEVLVVDLEVSLGFYNL